MKIAVVLLVFCVAMSGCCVLMSVDVRNRSNKVISVQTTQTGKAYEIAAGDHERIPHTVGDLIVSVEGAREVSRVSVSVPDYEAEKTCFPRSLHCWNGLAIQAEFTDAGGLIVLNTRRIR
jgi:hypothetical protein